LTNFSKFIEEFCAAVHVIDISDMQLDSMMWKNLNKEERRINIFEEREIKSKGLRFKSILSWEETILRLCGSTKTHLELKHVAVYNICWRLKKVWRWIELLQLQMSKSFNENGHNKNKLGLFSRILKISKSNYMSLKSHSRWCIKTYLNATTIHMWIRQSNSFQ
jgi:hypothetical protein